MKGGNANGGRSTRIHAIVLTRDRSEVLRRCIDTALSTLESGDALTILDDSCAPTLRANAAVLIGASGRSTTHISHLWAEELHDAITRDSGGQRAVWQSKTAPRDIAPLRNLSLLISSAVDARTTVLVDDDICNFDLHATHRMVEALDCGSEGLIAGAAIGGISEQDTVTRLMDAMRLLASTTDSATMRAEEILRAPSTFDDRAAGARGWVSAGYMAFRLAATSLFAFPPGYNEDWLWCLLHDAGSNTRVLRIDHVVSHEPPSLRRPTREDILFELAGDLIFDCVAKRGRSRHCEPHSALEDVVSHSPDPDVVPGARVRAVLDYARCLSEAGHAHGLHKLAPYGLGILGDLVWSGALEMDGNAIASAWSRDATAKGKSFAATLGDAKVHDAVAAMLQGGRL